MKDKLILTDCDGVLLDWVWGFDMWMTKQHGYKKITNEHYSMAECYGLTSARIHELINTYNESVNMYNMSPLRNAIKYIRKLHEDYGYVFHVITSIGTDPRVVEARTTNLHRVFGVTPFYSITCMSPFEPKSNELRHYKDSDCLWVEDHYDNYNMGRELGLRSLLMNQPYNQQYTNVARVHSWQEIYEGIT